MQCIHYRNVLLHDFIVSFMFFGCVSIVQELFVQASA